MHQADWVCHRIIFFPSPPRRVSRPEAAGLRHLAFEVDSLDDAIEELDRLGIAHEDACVDEYTGKRFTFLQDPDSLPIELYEKETNENLG